MDFKQLCNQRYSLRNYSDEVVPLEVLDEMLQCASLAPSAVNYQPWHFYVLRSAEALEKVKQCYNRPWFQAVTTCFIICKDNDKAWVRSSDGKQFGDVDIAIATEHLCLAAAEKGVGSCWVCNFDAKLCQELFNIPENLEPMVLLPVGYPAAGAEVPKKTRRDMFESMNVL